MKFSRNNSCMGITWAFNALVKHHTEINNMYWSFVPAWSFTNYMARKNSDATPEALFHASGPDVHRLDHSIPNFIRNSELLANWVRLSVLLSALSYFEIYMKKVVTLSLMSDPAVRLGRSGVIEGVSWIKSGLQDDLDSLVTPCLKGECNSRILAYKRLFKVAPASLEAEKDKLDAMRVLRNKVGHSYGRNLKVEILETTIAPMSSLSEAGLKECLELVFNVARDIDAHLLSNHIGCFEEALFFHRLRGQLRGIQCLDEAKYLRKAMARELDGRTPGSSYCRGLVSFYHSC